MPTRLPLLLLCLLAASPAGSRTTDVTPTRFVSTFHEDLEASPGEAWQALVHIGAWWSAQHTYSGDAANLSLDASAGGCWCERWAGNSVQHARVLVAMPGKLLRLEGGLGPLQALGATGILTFRLSPRGEGSALDVTYHVAASSDAALDKAASAVDGVLAEQVKRLVASMPKVSPPTTPPR